MGIIDADGVPDMDDDVEFNIPPVDYRAVSIAVIYFAGMIVWGVDIWKATVFAGTAFFCSTYNFGRVALQRGAVTILFLGLAIWTGALPSPDQWRQVIRTTVADFSGKTITVTVVPQGNID